MGDFFSSPLFLALRARKRGDVNVDHANSANEIMKIAIFATKNLHGNFFMWSFFRREALEKRSHEQFAHRVNCHNKGTSWKAHKTLTSISSRKKISTNG